MAVVTLKVMEAERDLEIECLSEPRVWLIQRRCISRSEAQLTHLKHYTPSCPLVPHHHRHHLSMTANTSTRLSERILAEC